MSIAQYCRSFMCITSSYFSFHTGNIKIELWWVLLQSFTMQTTPLTRLSYFTLLLTLVRSIQCIISYWEISMLWVHLSLQCFHFFPYIQCTIAVQCSVLIPSSGHFFFKFGFLGQSSDRRIISNFSRKFLKKTKYGRRNGCFTFSPEVKVFFLIDSPMGRMQSAD